MRDDLFDSGDESVGPVGGEDCAGDIDPLLLGIGVDKLGEEGEILREKVDVVEAFCMVTFPEDLFSHLGGEWAKRGRVVSGDGGEAKTGVGALGGPSEDLCRTDPEFLKDVRDCRRDSSEVFADGDHRGGVDEGFEDRLSVGCREESAVLTRHLKGDAPDAEKAEDVIETVDVEEVAGIPEPFLPPAVVVFFHLFPSEERKAPVLPFRIVHVGRGAGGMRGVKVIRVGHHISAVSADKKGDVSHQLNPTLCGVVFHLFHLKIAEILEPDLVLVPVFPSEGIEGK